MTLVIAPGVTDTTKSNAKPIQGDTILVYLTDRSGSMGSCWEETIGGLNEDLAVQQKNDDGNTEAAFFFFDGSGFGDNKTRIVKPFEGSLKEATQLDAARSSGYGPSGSTPLYDAVGQMIVAIRERVAATPKGANVIVSIFTDGGNTDHHGYGPDEVKRMVEACQGEGWTFTYFGANQDAWAVGGTFGIAKGNTMSYDTSNMRGIMASASTARTSHINMAKSAHAEGVAYTSATYFADAGQTEEDYKG